jgi:hypothetical protein
MVAALLLGTTIYVAGSAQNGSPSRDSVHQTVVRSVTWDAIAIFRMQNGKIAEQWVSRDELGILLSVGALKPSSDAKSPSHQRLLSTPLPSRHPLERRWGEPPTERHKLNETASHGSPPDRSPGSTGA